MSNDTKTIVQAVSRETLQGLVNDIAEAIRNKKLKALISHLNKLSEVFKIFKRFIGQGKSIATQKAISDFNVEDAIAFIKQHYIGFNLEDNIDMAYRKQGALIQEALQMYCWDVSDEGAEKITHLNEINTALKVFAGITNSDFVSRDLQFSDDEVDALLPLVKERAAIKYQEKKILEGVPVFLRDEFQAIFETAFQSDSDKYQAISRCLTRQLLLDDAHQVLMHYASFLEPNQRVQLLDTWYHFQTYANAGFSVSHTLLHDIETKLETHRQQYIGVFNANIENKKEAALIHVKGTQVLTTDKDWALYYTTSKTKAMESRDTYVTYQASRMLIDNIVPVVNKTAKTHESVPDDTAKETAKKVPKEEMAKEWIRSIYNTILSRNDWVKFGGEKIEVNKQTLTITHHQKAILDTILSHIHHQYGKELRLRMDHGLGDYPYTKLANKLQMIGQQAEQSRGFGRLFRTDETSHLYKQVSKGVASHDNDTGLMSRERIDSLSDVSVSTCDVKTSMRKG